MKMRLFYEKKEIEAQLKAASVQPPSQEKPWEAYPWGGFRGADDPQLVYNELNSTTEAVSPLANDLTPVRISVHAKVAAEQNQHLKQGAGTFGDQTRWEVEFQAEKFSVPTANSCMSAFAFRAVIAIWIVGTNQQSVRDCYDKIRRGELGGDWQGEPSMIVATSEMPIEEE